MIRPATVALQSKVHSAFLDWLQAELSLESWTSICRSPHLQVIFLRSYGNWLYNDGKAMYLFRHLVVFCQQQFPGERHQIQPAWQLLQRWEAVQPGSHRPPLPKVILDAMLCLAMSWNWFRWAAVTAIAFHGACRVGEPLSAQRKDLILPDEAGLSDSVCFLNIAAPKTSRRGRGRTQHTKITDAATVQLAKTVFSHLRPDEPLYPSTLDSYRRRWGRLLMTLGVPSSARLTPGCVRGGGAVHLYHVGTPIANIQWVMRLKVLQTLEHYLQETAALGVLNQLSTGAKSKVFSCAKIIPIISRLFTSDLSPSE